MKRVAFLIVATALFLISCKYVSGNDPAGNLQRHLKPDLDEQKAYHDIVFDDYPQRYPEFPDLYGTVATDTYSLSLPKGWSMDDGISPKIYDENKKPIGQIDTRSIDPGSSLLGNHAELVYGSVKQESGNTVLTLIYAADEPAASGIDTITIRQAMCFVDKTGQMGTYLTFDKAYVDHNIVEYRMLGAMIERISKTFRMPEK